MNKSRQPSELTLLVFGGDGQVGRELQRLRDKGPIAIHSPTREAVDILDPEQVRTAFESSNCDVVVNAAAYTAVDRAEIEVERAYAVNQAGTEVLATACRDFNRPLIHLSTDYVFDGLKLSPYREDDTVAPLGVYGKSKVAGEGAVRAILDHHVILRTAWVFSAHRQNFVKTMMRLADERNEIRIVDDQRGSPTSAAFLARSIEAIAGQITSVPSNPEIWGTYHLCCFGEASWFEFAREIFALRSEWTGRSSPKLIPIKTAEFPTEARRPANSVLDCTRLEKAFNIERPAWQQELKEVVRELTSPGERL